MGGGLHISSVHKYLTFTVCAREDSNKSDTHPGSLCTKHGNAAPAVAAVAAAAAAAAAAPAAAAAAAGATAAEATAAAATFCKSHSICVLHVLHMLLLLLPPPLLLLLLLLQLVLAIAPVAL